jgi:hypothetical protein
MVVVGGLIAAALAISVALAGSGLIAREGTAAAAFDPTDPQRNHVLRENGPAAAFDPTAAQRNHVLRENHAD